MSEPIKNKAPSRFTMDSYQDLYRQSIENNEAFWRQQGQILDWFKPYSEVKDVSFDQEDLHIRWYADGELNVSYNCIDRHLPEKADKTAIIWEGDDPKKSRHISFADLHSAVCRFANVLKKMGVQKGDRVTLYMPMIPEAAYAMLACTRIGAVHSVVFGGFSADALADRIINCESKFVITADYSRRGGKKIPLKSNVDKAAEKAGVKDYLSDVLVIQTDDEAVQLQDHDHWYHALAKEVSDECQPVAMNAEDPLFILYTSGSTGSPKGVLHTTGGYLVYSALTHKEVFGVQNNDVYWCTADIGWVTGHSYVVYGPLANGCTTVMFEGVPSYPDFSRFWQIVDKHHVDIVYTAPTAIRALMKQGDAFVEKTSRKSLRVLGSVGEPINVEAWEWYYEVVGDKRCPVIDTWWQTETGGMMITPLAGVTPLKPGKASLPFFGIQPALMDAEGQELSGQNEGQLVIKDSWPGQMRTVYGDHDRFYQTYFSMFKGVYTSGDGARRDEDGFYRITGRVDDVINVSGHRMGTAEVESAIDEHDQVVEAAVVGYPHDVKGQGIYVYAILNNDDDAGDELAAELKQWVRQEIGPIATPDLIQFTPSLPKTRSGKIMRRILRKIAANEIDSLGDTTTLAEPEVVEQLIENRLNR